MEMTTHFPTILVGNGRSLLDSARGELIDTHQTVVRFNHYQLKPEFTGTRTDVWAINRNLLVDAASGKLATMACSGSIFAMVHSARNEHPWIHFERNAFRLGFEYLPRKTVREAYVFFGKWQPTTGALALGYYAERGGCALIAFDRMENGPIHWYDEVPHKPTIHNAELEQKWIEVHVKSGKAIVL
jgi:hypothetical protein